MNSAITEINALAALWSDAITRAAWQGGAVLVLVWLMSRWITWLPARYKVWLWRLAFLKLVLVFIWITPIPIPVLPAALPEEPVQVTAPPIEYPSELNSPVAFPAAPSGTPSLSAQAWLLLAWIGGIAAALVNLARQWQAANKLSQQSRPIENQNCLKTLLRLAERCGLRRPPSVCKSQTISSPILIGIFRARIILPRSALE